MICLHHKKFKNGTKNQIPCIPGGTIKYVLYKQLYVTYLYTIVALITIYIYTTIYIQFIHIIYTIFICTQFIYICTQYIHIYIVERLK